MKTLTIKVPVHVLGDYCGDSSPDYVQITFSQNLIDTILKYQQVAEEIGCAKICSWVDVDCFMTDAEEPVEEVELQDFKSECEMFSVWKDSIWISGYEKYTGTKWESDAINIGKLTEDFYVC